MRSRRIIGSSWVLIGLAVLLFILWRTSATGAQAEPVPANGGTGPVMELAPGDLVRARIARFTQDRKSVV